MANFWKKRFKNLVKEIEERGGEAATCSNKMCANVCIDMYVGCDYDCYNYENTVDWYRCHGCQKLMDYCNECVSQFCNKVDWKDEYKCGKCE